MSVRRKSPPYSNTPIDPGRSKAQIEKLLRDYGADAVQWTESFKRQEVQLRFVIQGERQPAMVRLIPPTFATKRRSWNPEKGRYEEVDSPNWAQSYRLLYYYLKAKLESVAYGLRDIEEEFLSDIVVHGADGSEATVGEIVQQQISSGQLRPMLPEGGPPTAPRTGKTVDVEARMVP